MKRISLAILLILLIPSILPAEEHNPSRLHMGFIVGGGLSYIGTLGETPRWEPESLGYFAPCVTYYTPTGLAIRAEIAKLNRASTMMDDTYYYQIREISSSSMHTPVTVLYPISKDEPKQVLHRRGTLSRYDHQGQALRGARRPRDHT